MFGQLLGKTSMIILILMWTEVYPEGKSLVCQVLLQGQEKQIILKNTSETNTSQPELT